MRQGRVFIAEKNPICTADIWMQKHGKRHLRGAVERAILEPLCYIVGKIK